MPIINYFFEKHIERCKKELKDFEINKFKDVREDLKAETRKYLEEINNFLIYINTESYTHLNSFNSQIKTFNNELNRIMKASANISPLVYVIQNIDEDEYYTYTNFISYFAYDESKVNNLSEIDIKYLQILDKQTEESADNFEVYKEQCICFYTINLKLIFFKFILTAHPTSLIIKYHFCILFFLNILNRFFNTHPRFV